MRLASIECSFDPCNIYRDGPRGVGFPADARSVGDSHPSCYKKSLILLISVISNKKDGYRQRNMRQFLQSA